MKSLESSLRFILFVISLSVFQSNAQNLNLFNKIELDSSLIKQHGIKSLIVYRKYSENGLIEPLDEISTKFMEVSFNNEGQKKYICSIPLHDSLILLGSPGTKWQWFEYDSLHRIISTRSKRKRNDQRYQFTYDKSNHIIQKDLSYDGVAFSTEFFNWKNGELIESDLRKANSPEKTNWTHTYDREGRLSRLESGGHMTEIESAQYLGILERSVISYKYGEVSAFGFTRKDVLRNRLFHLLSMDENRDTLHLISAKFDQHANICFFYQKDFVSRKRASSYPRPQDNPSIEKNLRNPAFYDRETIYEIENNYDNRGLLIIQKYFKVDPNSSQKKLVSVQRFIYKTSDLPPQINGK